MSSKSSNRLLELLKTAKIHEENGKYVLKSKDGKKVLGTHETREKALAQERAIQASKAGRRKHGSDSLVDALRKTSADKRKFYHGSPLDLDAPEPREPRKAGDFAGGHSGVYSTVDPISAALYALARDKEYKNRKWGVKGGRLIAHEDMPLNQEGYLYELESDDYIPPPEDQPEIGYALRGTPRVVSKKKISLEDYQDLIDRVKDREEFEAAFGKTSSDSRTAVIVRGNPDAPIDRKEELWDDYYARLRAILEGEGYSVKEDPGLPYTSPEKADVWLGHSRGSDRLRFAPKGTLTIPIGSTVEGAINHPDEAAFIEKVLGTPGYAKMPLSDRPTAPAGHLMLTDEMEKELRARLAAFGKTAAEEFAPGIPKSRKIEPIPDVQAAKWRLAIQEHDAERAGKHWDLRLVDPNKRKAHSWAVPKAKWPGKKNRLRLAIQQPTHTAHYALNFEGKIPSGTYGAGDVKIVKNTGTNVKVEDGVVRFSVPRVGNMVLRKTDGDKWLLMRAKKASDLSGQLKEKTILKTNTVDRLRKLISSTKGFKIPAGKHHIKLGPYGYALVRRKKDGSPTIFAVLPGGANPPGRDLGKQLPKDRLKKAIKSRWRAGSSSAVARLINILTKKSAYRPASAEVVGGDSAYYSTSNRDSKKDVEEFAPEAVKHTYKPEKGPFGELDRPGGHDFSAR